MCAYSFLNIKLLRSNTFNFLHVIVTLDSQLCAQYTYSRNIQSCGKVIFHCTLYIRFPGEVSTWVCLLNTQTRTKNSWRWRRSWHFSMCMHCKVKQAPISNLFCTIEAVDMCLHTTINRWRHNISINNAVNVCQRQRENEWMCVLDENCYVFSHFFFAAFRKNDM